MSNKPISWKPEFNILPSAPRATSKDIAAFETNTEAGAVATTSSNFQMSKGTAGGNYSKASSSSANFVLTGGAIHAL